MAVLEDPDLTAGLRELARHQPPQPDRLPAVASRVRRVRRRRAAMAVAAVVAVAGVPAAVLTRSPAPLPPPAVLAGATPLQQWPDRSRPGQQELGERALEAWRAESGVPLTRRVQWLFRGPVPAEGRAAYVAVFLAGSGAPQEVVTAVARSGDDGPTWRVEVRPAAAGLPSGAYVPADDGGGSTGFVLDDPAARSLTWSVDPLPGSPGTRGPSAGTAASADGVFVVPLPPLDGRVQVRTAGPSLPTGDARPLGDGDPPLVLPAELTVPRGDVPSMSTGGQAERRSDGSYDAALLDAATGWPTGADATAACYGEAPLVVALRGRRTTVPCDGRPHSAGSTGPAEAVRVDPRPGGLLAYRLALAPR